MNVFVAGASGTIGRRFVPLLVAGGHEVVAPSQVRPRAEPCLSQISRDPERDPREAVQGRRGCFAAAVKESPYDPRPHESGDPLLGVPAGLGLCLFGLLDVLLEVHGDAALAGEGDAQRALRASRMP